MLSSTDFTKFNNHSPLEGIGAALHRTKGTLVAVWDFAVQGGAVGTLSLLDDQGNAAVLPTKAIITNVIIDVLTACVSTGNNGTVALTANTSGDLLAAVDADTMSAIHAGIPVGTAATAVKLTAQRQIVLAIATNAMTAGKLRIFIDYHLSI